MVRPWRLLEEGLRLQIMSGLSVRGTTSSACSVLERGAFGSLRELIFA